MRAPWPKPAGEDILRSWGVDSALVEFVDQKHELIREGRMLRSDYGISPAKKIDYLIKPQDAESGRRLQEDSVSLKSLLRAESLTIDSALVPGKAMPSGMTKLATIYMPLAGLIDVEAERQSLAGQVEKLGADLERINAKLANSNFVGKAPADVVAQQRAKRDLLTQDIEKMKKLMSALASA